jgi:hypothetical protein
VEGPAEPPATPSATLPATMKRRDLLLLIVYGSLLLVACLPLWTVRYQPLPDLPEHLSALSIWHNHGDPRFDFARYYDVNLGLNPYWGYYGLLHLLAFPFGVETGNRVLLSLYVIGLPVGAAWLARRFGRSPWLGLFAIPLVWNFNFEIGFVTYCIGLAALPFALVAFDAFAERPTVPRGIAAASLGASMFFFHLLPWGMYIAGAGLIGLLREGRTLRRIAGRAAVWLSSVATGFAVARAGGGYSMGNLGQGIHGKVYPIRDSLRTFYHWIWNNCTSSTDGLKAPAGEEDRFPVVGRWLWENLTIPGGWRRFAGHEDELLAAVLLVCLMALRLTAPRRRLRLHDLRPEACFVAAMTAYLVLPRSILSPSYWWGVNIRFACMAALFAALTIGGEFGRSAERPWRRWLLVPVALVALGFSIDGWVHFRRAAAFTEGYDAMAALPAPGSRVLFIIKQPWRDDTYRHNYAQSFPGVYQMQHGGYMPWNFDESFPFKYRQRFPAPTWQSADFRWDQHARYYDYVMLFAHTPQNLFKGHESEVHKVAESGFWSLWKLPGPRVDVPPGPTYPGNWALDPKWKPPAPVPAPAPIPALPLKLN